MALNVWDAISDAWDTIFVSAQMAVAKDEARKKASAFNLKGSVDEFNELWGLMIHAMISSEINHEEAIAEVAHEIALLKDLVVKAPTSPTSFGHPAKGLSSDDGFSTVQVAPTAGRYAIFSDHHMLFGSCRQNFFVSGNFDKNTEARDGNLDLYLKVLNEYYGPEGYTLIENGDVEELLILEPVLSEIRGIGGWRWSRVKEYRNSKKLPQLAAIARDNHAYYSTIQRQFIETRRYFRLTGNHDRDMREQKFADTVSEAAGIDMPLASDALLLRGPGGVDFIICHGHQFDASCTPRFAEEQGESFTQAEAWAMQGPDRAWRLDFDPIDDWLDGDRGFNNTLVADAPSGENRLEPFDLKIPGDAKKIALGIGKLLGALDKPWQWESLMGKNIAWSYFDNDNATTAIEKEVSTGKRWFKFRHMNEMRIVDGLRKAFAHAPSVPTLVLGHSHEPRFRAEHPKATGDAAVAGCYLNSASAGRFQNLIWGIELIDGEPFMISWHSVPAGSLRPVRTIWRDHRDARKSVLRPELSATLEELLAAAKKDEPRERMALMIVTEHAL